MGHDLARVGEEHRQQAVFEGREAHSLAPALT
jgi:hypothetical protein